MQRGFWSRRLLCPMPGVPSSAIKVEGLEPGKVLEIGDVFAVSGCNDADGTYQVVRLVEAFADCVRLPADPRPTSVAPVMAIHALALEDPATARIAARAHMRRYDHPYFMLQTRQNGNLVWERLEPEVSPK